MSNVKVVKTADKATYTASHWKHSDIFILVSYRKVEEGSGLQIKSYIKSSINGQLTLSVWTSCVPVALSSCIHHPSHLYYG